MQEITTILQKGMTRIRRKIYLPVKEAITLARDNGMSGRLEIQNTLFDKGDAVTYLLYFINEENKIVGWLHPYRHLNVEFLFNKTVTAKAEEQPDKIINIIRRNGKRNHATQIKTLMRPHIISD